MARLATIAICFMLSLAGALRLVAQGPLAQPLSSEPPSAEPRSLVGLWGAQTNGSYVNPVLPGDFSDLDVIRVGQEYVAISSTMQYSPGMAVLHSTDLVNWTIAGHVVPDLTVLDPALNWDRMDRQGRGIWAGSIRMHAGRFYVYFGTPDQGIFMSSAADIRGPWTRAKLMVDAAGWDDPCPFWDDDGQGYLVTTHFARDAAGLPYTVHLFKMNAAGNAVVAASDRVMHHSEGSEANKLYKWNGTYYHYYSEVKPEGRVAMMERSRSLAGPWETQQLMHVHAATDKEPNQGGLVQVPDGRWYFLTHQGHGAWEGRAGVLLPVHWRNGWPMLGQPGADGIGNMVWTGPMPITGQPLTSVAASDDFHSAVLKPEWEWRYQPRVGAWSLLERPGYLRLRAYRPMSVPPPAVLPGAGKGGRFAAVENVLTQRAYRSRLTRATVELDVTGMVDGQEAGLAHYGADFASLGVTQRDGVRRFSFSSGKGEQMGPRLRGATVYLRSDCDAAGQCRFWLSEDGRTYQQMGERYQATWAAYRGDRVGIYTVNRQRDAGFVDVHAFAYTVARR